MNSNEGDRGTCRGYPPHVPSSVLILYNTVQPETLSIASSSNYINNLYLCEGGLVVKQLLLGKDNICY